jgi:hypothetical protein
MGLDVEQYSQEPLVIVNLGVVSHPSVSKTGIVADFAATNLTVLAEFGKNDGEAVIRREWFKRKVHQGTVLPKW